MDEETKQNMHAKIDTYKKRIEEIKNTTKIEQPVDNNEIDDRVAGKQNDRDL